jgi:hypothetical protein
MQTSFPIDPIHSHVSLQARFLVGVLGTGLCLWVFVKMRRRTVSIPTSTLLLCIGLGIVGFAAHPQSFDGLAYILHVYYPPVLYALLAFVVLFLVILQFSLRLSAAEEMCKRLAQEIALMNVKGPVSERAGKNSVGQDLP